MATPFNPNFNPAQVMLGSGGKGPYMNTKEPAARTSPQARTSPEGPRGPAPGSVLGAQAVRASGTGPFDPAYRQDLSTYAGGNFARPGGSLSFNPTGQMFGQPTGAGSAPVPGLPTDMLTAALGGQGFVYSPPKPKPAATPRTDPRQNWWSNWQGDSPFRR